MMIRKSKPTSTESTSSSIQPGPIPAKKVTLSELCKELKIDPRDARTTLRMVLSDAARFPDLAASHKSRQPWEWGVCTIALAEAKRALSMKIS